MHISSFSAFIPAEVILVATHVYYIGGRSSIVFSSYGIFSDLIQFSFCYFIGLVSRAVGVECKLLVSANLRE